MTLEETAGLLGPESTAVEPPGAGIASASAARTVRDTPPPALAEMVEVRGRFHRSVHVARDWADGLEGEYFATPALLGLAEQIADELGREAGTRAWTVTGPYGAGKSAFTLFLARALASAEPTGEAARVLRDRCLGDCPPLLPILIQAERAPLAPAIVEAVAGAGGLRLGRRAKGALTRPSSSVDLLVEAAARSEGGVALIVDELGKYLEYAAADPKEDVFLLQQLAEAAARSKKPLLFVCVLHSGFGDYVSAGDPARRAEWQKVQGRFRDVPFALPEDELLELVGHALTLSWSRDVERGYRSRLIRLLRAPALADSVERRGLRAAVAGCLPLHPVTSLLMWPLFRSKVAQNERSLFAFLSSHEPYGFQEFLRRERVPADGAALYRLPELYDYVVSALGMAAATGEDARYWGLIAHALERVPASAPPTVARLVKCIGLLSLYGDSIGVRADRELLCAVLDDCDESEVEAALEILERESIVLWRRHRRCYGLWEGSDLDLDVAFDRAVAQLGREPLCRRLQRVAQPRPLVARGHYVRTGTLRFFEPRIAGPTPQACEEALNEPTRADGVLLFLVGDLADSGGSSGRDGTDHRVARALELSELLARKQAVDALAQRSIAGRAPIGSSGRPVLVALPKRSFELGSALDELDAWRWVRENVGELAGDAVARVEVAARETAARRRFEEVVGGAFGLPRHVLDPSASRWFFGGEEIERIERPRDLQERLSEICEQTYPDAPPLHNELLNRHNLSSAAARARRELTARIFTHGDRERMGIEGFPPEYSMYCSMLEAAGFHRDARPRGFGIHNPNSRGWKPLWKEIGRFVDASRSGPQSLSDLIETLEAPPYGLRRGPIPVLIAVLLRLRGPRLALYEDDLFVPRVEIETLERLVRRPETFAIRSFDLGAEERRVVEKLGALAGETAGDPAAGGAAGLLAVVRNLVQLVSRLPPYTRRTRRLSADAQAVRELLLEARDPRDLLLRELPEALGVASDRDADGPVEFARRLGRAVRELDGALRKLLLHVERSVREGLGFEERGRALRSALRDLARPLLDHAPSGRLELFLSAAARAEEGLLDEWRSSLALAIADGLPAEHWNDDLAGSLGARLRTLRLELDELEHVARVAGAGSGVPVGSLRVRMPAEDETRIAFPCRSSDREEALRLAEIWRDAARRGSRSLEVQAQALALLACELDSEAESNSGVKDVVAVGGRKVAPRSGSEPS